MLVCQWHIDIPFGKQKDVLEILKKWDDEIASTPGVPKFHSQRTMVGHIGLSPSHVVNEYVVDSLADWEAMLKLVAAGHYRKHAEAIAQYVVPGSQHWVILRITD